VAEQERSPLVHALFDRLRLPPSVAAEVDWASGVLLVNRGLAQWQQLFKDPMADPPLLTTLEHEAHHIIQISTLTYLYRFAVTIHSVVASILNEHYGNLQALPETLGPQAEVVRNLVWDLNWRDEDGLSVVDIVESLTYFNEANAVHEFSHTDYLEYLRKRQVADVYKRGYEVFDKYTRGVTNPSPLFPVICHLSLCSWDPRKCFVGLATALAAGRISNQPALTDLLSICEQLDPTFPGLAPEFRRQLPTFGIRCTFTEVQDALTADEQTVQKLWGYFVQPHQHSTTFMLPALARTPAVLNPVGDSGAADFRKWFTDMRGIRSFGAFTMEQRPYWLLYLAAVSRKYVESVGTPPPGAVRKEIV
jgi:hypothetical protein